MVEVEHVTTASVEDVMRVLADGWLYGLWVTGASHIRGVDPGWPAEGTQIHHAVGAWPLLIKDETTSRDWDPSGHLKLCARAWPVGEADVELTVRPNPASAGGSVITMGERAAAGPGKLLAPAQRLLLPPRNRESLSRLGYLAEGRRTLTPR